MALNPAQHKAVHTLSGPLLVLAGAGTGKTRVVTYRIANLIRNGVQPSRILGVTFTNKAATEMQQRIRETVGRGLKDDRPQVSTFHSYCVKLLRRNITRLGYPAKFAIYDRGDQEMLARRVLREIKAPNTLMRPAELVNYIGDCKTHSIDIKTATRQARTDKEHLGSAGYRRYQDALKTAGAVDFDDLLLRTVELLTKFPDVREQEAGLFDHILVDEYQDTNRSQYQIVSALARGHRNLCVVGDDDQSIYAWRGAEVEHILRFAKDWRDAVVVRLEENYRSTEEILTLANRLIAFNSVRHDKVLRAARAGGERPRIDQYNSETEEAEGVISDIRRRATLPGREFRDFAILFRTNEQPRLFEQTFREQKVPYILIGGKSFYDRKEVKDLMAYLRVAVSPSDDISLRRILNTPKRGIGDKVVQRLGAEAASEGSNLWTLLKSNRLSGKAATSFQAFRDELLDFRKRCKSSPKQMSTHVKRLIERINYEEELNRLYESQEERDSRWASVEEFVNSVGQYQERVKEPSVTGFLDEMTLDDRDMGNDKESQLKRNAVALLTLHSAKGLEFPEVYMVGLEDGILPHKRSLEDDKSIEEERRLCYVGVTRAQERLTLSMCLSRMKWGKPRETTPSQFLFELIGQAENARAKRTPQRKRRDATQRTPTKKKRSTKAAKKTSTGRQPAKKRAKKKRGTG